MRRGSTCIAGAAFEFDEDEAPYSALREAVLAVASYKGRPNSRTFGRWLSRHKGRISVGLRLNGEADTHGHPAQWWVEKIENS